MKCSGFRDRSESHGMGNGQRTVAVIGAGVSGLACTFELIERSQRGGDPIDVICFEAGDRAGGNIRTEAQDGFVCEWGPNGFLDGAQTTLTLVRRLGLASRLVPAEDAAGSRYVYRDGRLRTIPTSPRAFLTSDVVNWPTKLRILFEPWVRKGRGDDESVFEFAARRIGRGAASVMVDAMVSGVYAGDAANLSVEATFPKLHAMERKHGSLFAALRARKKQSDEIEGDQTSTDESQRESSDAPAGRLTSFRGGMQELVDALAKEVGDSLRLNQAVRSISDLGLRGFRLLFDEGAPLDVDAVILAAPAWHAAPMVESMNAALASTIASIPSAALAVVHFGYRRQALGEQPSGFGFLVPRNEGVRILGTIWSSDVFPGRAPEGSRLFTTMIGGAHDPGAVELSDTALADAVRHDLDRCMGIAVRPYMERIIRHRTGIPQYTLGHPDRLSAIDAQLAEHPGLWLAGNSYRGIAVNACIEEAPTISEAVLEHIARSTEQSNVL